MPLPKKVQEIGDAAEAAAVEAGMKSGQKPEISAAAPAVAAVPDPKTPEPKVDPTDYKERFSRYKKQTDETINELRQTLADIQTTLTESQRQNQELMTKLNSKPAEPAPSQPAADPGKDPAYLAWLDGLPQKIKDEYTEDYLLDQYIIQTSAAGQQISASPDNLQELEQKVGHLEQVAAKTESQLYEEAMDLAYPDDRWITLTKAPLWNKFANQKISPVDQRTYSEIVKQGHETSTAQSVIWVLKQFEQYLSEGNDAAGGAPAADPLESQLTPECSGGGGGDPIAEINAQTETFTKSQVDQFFKEAATGNKYSAEEVEIITQKMYAAQAAGKIVPG